MKKNKIIKISLLIIVSVFAGYLLTANLTEAATLWDNQKTTTGIDKVGSQAFDGETPQDIRVIIARVIQIFLGFLGIVLLILLVWAGFKYMTSQGNEEKIEESIDQIRNAIIGLLIIMVSWTITTYIISCALDLTGASTVWMCHFGN